MSKIQNQVFLHNDYAEIQITKTGDASYKGSTLVDKEDLGKFGKLKISNSGYAYTCSGSESLSHIVLNHRSNRVTVVDHINGNRLDNRKCNLRIVTQAENATNRNSSPRNNTGVIGIQLRSNGKYEYYRATVSDRKTKMGFHRGKTKQISKQFNINKLGKEEAFRLAKVWLESKRKEFGYL